MNSGETPEILHRIRRVVRKLFKRFETSRTDEPPYETTWNLRVRVERDKLDGGWIAECLDLPGCMSQGDTEDEALDNLADALGGVVTVTVRKQVELKMRSHHDNDGHDHEFKPAMAQGREARARRR